MMKLAIIHSSDDFVRRLLSHSKPVKVRTRHGAVRVLQEGDIHFINRHYRNKPPHMINHRANILALKKLGVKSIVGCNSVGSLKTSLKPGSIVLPHDYINLWNIISFYDKKIVHITPEISPALREKLVRASKKAGVRTINKGVYFQTTGPRLETKAEISMIKNYADVVGMTMASEATLSKELGIDYASICSVDNYANGITEEELNNKEILKNKQKNSAKLVAILKQLIKEER